MTPELLVDARATLGECVLWCDVAQALYWTDIEGACIRRWQAADGQVRRWALPDRVGSFALCEQPSRLLLGLATGIALFDLELGALVSPIVAVEADIPSTRINDGRCDAQGRFVFGMYDAAEAPLGHFYRVDADLRIERLPLPAAAVANSIAFSPEGTRLYFADSPTRQIHCADYAANGRIGTPRLFTQLGAGEGFPDGSTVDADGGLWNAQWDGGCIVRYDRTGRETARVALPASRPTCVAFGGPGLERAFVSTARAGLSAEALQRQPGAGGVFALRPGQRGLPEHRFAAGRQA